MIGQRIFDLMREFGGQPAGGMQLAFARGEFSGLLDRPAAGVPATPARRNSKASAATAPTSQQQLLGHIIRRVVLGGMALPCGLVEPASVRHAPCRFVPGSATVPCRVCADTATASHLRRHWSRRTCRRHIRQDLRIGKSLTHPILGSRHAAVEHAQQQVEHDLRHGQRNAQGIQHNQSRKNQKTMLSKPPVTIASPAMNSPSTKLQVNTSPLHQPPAAAAARRPATSAPSKIAQQIKPERY